MNKLRRIIGFLALIFPIGLIIGTWTGGTIPPMGISISSYYWATDNVLFVAMLTICGAFLIFYEGYDLGDKRITTAAGISMLLLTFFPCLGTSSPDYLFLFFNPKITDIIHGTSAAITFSLLGYMSYFQFTKSRLAITYRKRIRNKIYRACGLIIFGALIVIAIITINLPWRIATDKIRLFYWMESIILWAFGFSWLVKGNTILKDPVKL